MHSHQHHETKDSVRGWPSFFYVVRSRTKPHHHTMNHNLNNNNSSNHRGVAWFQQHSPSPPSSTSSSRSSGSGRNLLFPDVAMTSPTAASTLRTSPMLRTTPRRSPGLTTAGSGGRRIKVYPPPPPRVTGSFNGPPSRQKTMRQAASAEELELVDVIDIEDADLEGELRSPFDHSNYAAFFVGMPASSSIGASSSSSASSSSCGPSVVGPHNNNTKDVRHSNTPHRLKNKNLASPRQNTTTCFYNSPSMHLNTPLRRISMVF